MRPRVFPAEDAFVLLAQCPKREASMRPRVFPAEDQCRPRGEARKRRASMRPRVFPAEDQRWFSSHQHFQERFNEAAGIPRGL